MPGTAHDDESRDSCGRRRWVRDADAERGNAAGRGIVAELQEALLPTALPVLPRARIAARYLVAGQEQAAGGDWFDAIPLDGGARRARRRGRGGPRGGRLRGDGAAARRAGRTARRRGRPRARAAADRRVRRPDAVAARRHPRAGGARPGRRDAALHHLRASPAAGLGVDGTARYLAGTGTGPLGTGSPPVLASSALAPGELVLLYSDGLVERPDRTIAEGMAELAVVAAGAAANRCGRAGPHAGHARRPDLTAAERVCQLTVELLTRTGHADDITALAAQWLAEPVPALHLSLPSERPSLTTARDAFADWLSRLDATADDWEALHLAMVEVFTNAIEHAYPREASPGPSSSTRPWARRQRGVPDHRPRHLAAARPGRRGPRPRPDGGRARRGQAAGQPPGAAAAPDDGDAAAPAAPARHPGLGPPGRARRAPGRAAVHRGHLRRGGRHGPGAGRRPGRHHHRRPAGPAAAIGQPGRHGPAGRRPDRRHPAGQRRGPRAVPGQRAAGGARPEADPGHRARAAPRTWCSTWSGWTT